ncbi:unnamed protein product [Pleuronectes platessa]|uniref:Secreted protein n=1 Tax=Pleuronectes platessa TaxID=8262 RepID=A0A9N7YDV8_PLEPL|nr:unnamed protein product [Pleuronectes platessa]
MDTLCCALVTVTRFSSCVFAALGVISAEQRSVVRNINKAVLTMDGIPPPDSQEPQHIRAPDIFFTAIAYTAELLLLCVRLHHTAEAVAVFRHDRHRRSGFSVASHTCTTQQEVHNNKEISRAFRGSPGRFGSSEICVHTYSPSGGCPLELCDSLFPLFFLESKVMQLLLMASFERALTPYSSVPFTSLQGALFEPISLPGRRSGPENGSLHLAK